MSEPPFTLHFHDKRLVSKLRHPARSFAGYPNCEFRPSKGYPFDLQPQAIQIVEILYCSSRTTVYLGRCDGGKEIALKFTAVKDILIEAAAYDALAPIQGTVLPQLYGVLCGRRPDESLAHCLVLERFGDILSDDFDDLSRAQKSVRPLLRILFVLTENHVEHVY